MVHLETLGKLVNLVYLDKMVLQEHQDSEVLKASLELLV